MIALVRHLSLIVGTNEEIVRKWLESTLETMGARVQHAFCGWDLLRLLSLADRIDLVILDGCLPSPGGLRTLALARTIGMDVPFLLIADPADFEVRTAAARLGAGLLARPLCVDDLARQVRQTCPSARVGGPPTTLH